MMSNQSLGPDGEVHTAETGLQVPAPVPPAPPAPAKWEAFAKAIWAFLSTTVGALIVAVEGTPHGTLGEVHTLAWLTAAGMVIGVTGGVYGFTNRTAPQ